MTWQPIETAPQNKTIIDILRSTGERCTNMCRVDLGNGNVFYAPWSTGPCVVRDATHWMPLPKPPTE